METELRKMKTATTGPRYFKVREDEENEYEEREGQNSEDNDDHDNDEERKGCILVGKPTGSSSRKKDVDHEHNKHVCPLGVHTKLSRMFSWSFFHF